MKRVKLKAHKNVKPLFSVMLLLSSLPLCLGAQEKLLRINTDLTALPTATVPSAGAFNSPIDASKQDEHGALPLDADSHICVREETYVEQLKVPTMQPVRIRSSQWCMEIPPRCSNYKTEMREVVQIKNVTKTRTIRFCCAGYEGNISINDTVCKPVCRGGCGRGYCQTPDVCSCEPGYTGTHCTQRCDHDHWGDECKQKCKCQNGAVCDNKSGICHCTTGWTGEFCELPCPTGTFGVMCHKACDCVEKRCHPQTGACGDALTPVMPNVTHVMIQTLNSTIVNITHKLDRIANKIVTIATSTLVPPQLTAAPEVIVIKQEDQHTPKIIVHQPGLSGGLLSDLHTAGGKTPEVIHVITAAGADWPTHANGSMIGAAQDAKLSLAGIGGVIESPAHTLAPTPTAAEHDANLLSTLLVLLLIIVVAIGISWLYIYRRYHWQKQRVEAALAARNASFGGASAELGGGSGSTVDATAMSGVGGKSFLKPLPDLPAFTQMVRNKIEAGPEFYDAPSNNSSVNTSAYDYARKLSLYSIVSPKSRKGSPDSHLYDEIRYPAAYQQQQQQQQHNFNTQHRQRHHSQQQQHPQHNHPQFSNHQQQQQQHHIHTTNALGQASLSPHAQQLQKPMQHAQISAFIAQQPLTATTLQQQQHHIAHLIIPPQNANFLQVPSASASNVNATNNSATRKVALI
ncbi:uncharacterized protein LOC105232283 isoform X1 [Bactrocera dorsalis]|uniref:Uncharacterized protein LOC105232283 isoform X1 n=1 Tax=Bactrocera dorsalis TaxID=27457 RepID=A0A6I9VM14_BACDO|nr:uncharacterized protein LOC105232283 isoform X1 [Bactrocera dorsalis]